MRIRTIKPEWLEDENMATASLEARVASVALILSADDEGRLRCAAKILAGRIFPGMPEAQAMTERALAELESMGFLQRYEFEGKGYAVIPGFLRHQKVDKPKASRLPPPPTDSETSRRHVADDSVTTQEPVADESSLFHLGSGSGNGSGMEVEHGATRRRVDDSPCSSPPNEPDIVTLADRALQAEHEWTYRREHFAPAIRTIWGGWRKFTGKASEPEPRTFRAARPIVEALANGHSPETIRDALANAHPQCWARGKGLAAALSNLPSLASGPDSAPRSGVRPAGQTRTAGSHHAAVFATIRAKVSSALRVSGRAPDDPHELARMVTPIAERLDEAGWDSEGDVPSWALEVA